MDVLKPHISTVHICELNNNNLKRSHHQLFFCSFFEAATAAGCISYAYLQQGDFLCPLEVNYIDKYLFYRVGEFSGIKARQI